MTWTQPQIDAFELGLRNMPPELVEWAANADERITRLLIEHGWAADDHRDRVLRRLLLLDEAGASLGQLQDAAWAYSGQGHRLSPTGETDDTGQQTTDIILPSATRGPESPPERPGPVPWVERLQAATLDEAGLEALPEPTWLIEGWMPANEFCCIYGPPKHAKTFLALDMALHVASSRTQWHHNHECATGTVIYLIGEGATGFKQRIRSWRTANAYTGPLDIRFIPVKGASFRNPEFVAGLTQYVHNLDNVVWIIADTFARFSGAMNENDAAEMQAMTDGLELIATDTRNVTAIHHEGKTAGMGLRGHSALAGAVYFALQVEKDETGPRPAVYAEVTHAKDAPEGGRARFWLEYPNDWAPSPALLEPDWTARRPDSRATRSEQLKQADSEIVASFGPDGCSAKEFQAAAGEDRFKDRRSAAKRLSDLKKQGEIEENPDRGPHGTLRYRHPKSISTQTLEITGETEGGYRPISMLSTFSGRVDR